MMKFNWLSNVHKLTYLEMQMQDEAVEFVQYTRMENEGYEEVWKHDYVPNITKLI